jgi:hypothetical protein
MGYESGDLKTMQSGKEIDLNTTLPAMIDFRDALRQAKTGFLRNEEKQITDNERKINQVRGLSLTISTLETLITLSMSQIEFRSKQKWEKENKNLAESEKKVFFERDMPVGEMKYDYSKLMYWNRFLQSCRRSILHAEKTKLKQDDFMIIENVNGEDIFRLSNNFWDMLEDLQAAFAEIHLLMLINKVISSGVEQDEELTYKEQEQLFIERVREA